MKVLKYQFWHFLMLLILLAGIYIYINKDATLLEGELWGISTDTWLILAILSPILHHLYVVVCWRLELYYNSFTKTFGANGFKLFKLGFAILILSRPVSITLVAIANANTFPVSSTLAYILAGILFIPAAYLFYSLRKYFGIDRAFGLDHFRPEEFKNKPLIKKGIFKYTSNGMYIYGFLLLWIPGLLFLSKAALLVALFNHIFIWGHYYFTELPDMKTIYNDL